VLSGRSLLTFQRFLLPSSSERPETLVNF
jgi:hypothetical protein